MPVYVAFALFGTVYFCDLELFSSFGMTMANLFSLLLGDGALSNLVELMAEYPWVGNIYVYSFSFLFIYAVRIPHKSFLTPLLYILLLFFQCCRDRSVFLCFVVVLIGAELVSCAC